VHLIDKKDGIIFFFYGGNDVFEPFLEIASILGPGNQCSHIQQVDFNILEQLRDNMFVTSFPGLLIIMDAQGQSFCYRRFTDTRFPYEQRVIFLSPTEYLHHPPADFIVSVNKRVNFTFSCQCRVIYRELGECFVFFILGGRVILSVST